MVLGVERDFDLLSAPLETDIGLIQPDRLPPHPIEGVPTAQAAVQSLECPSHTILAGNHSSAS